MSKDAFISGMMPHAQRVGQSLGIDPRIVLAQAALETGWGKAAPGNNYFGIKSHGQSGGQGLLTTEVVNGQPVQVRDSFRTYGGMGESADGYGEFLRQNPRYQPMLNAQGTEAQIAALASSGYATDPQYGQKISSIVNGLGGEPVANITGGQNMRQPSRVSTRGSAGGTPPFMPEGEDKREPAVSRGQQIAQGAALAFNQLRSNPDRSLAKQFQSQNEQATQRAAKNRTVEWLRGQGRTDLADAVEAGTISGRDAFGVMSQRPDPVKGVNINGKLVNPVTGEMIGDFSETPEGYEQIRGSELGLTGEMADRVFNRAPDGKITMVGGAGQTINVGAEEGAFGKETGKIMAQEAAEVVAQGSQAQRSMAQINTLEQALANAPSGAGGALLNAAANLGIKTEGSSDVEVANAIISQLVPAQRPPGSGVMSDADLEMFRQSLPRLINTREGNARIIETMRGIADYDMKRGQIARQLQLGEITPQQASQAYQALGNPLSGFQENMPNGGGDARQDPATVPDFLNEDDRQLWQYMTEQERQDLLRLEYEGRQ